MENAIRYVSMMIDIDNDTLKDSDFKTTTIGNQYWPPKGWKLNPQYDNAQYILNNKFQEPIEIGPKPK